MLKILGGRGPVGPPGYVYGGNWFALFFRSIFFSNRAFNAYLSL